MHSIDLIRGNLNRSTTRVLERIEDMRDHGLVYPTPNGGCHTLWVLGHLAYIEGLVTRTFMLGEPNPLDHWKALFDGDEVSANINQYPPFEDVLITCRQARQATIAHLNTLAEADLDTPSAQSPAGYEHTFGTYRLCFQYTADHWYMHRAHLADARRAAGVDRMWV